MSDGDEAADAEEVMAALADPDNPEPDDACTLCDRPRQKLPDDKKSDREQAVSIAGERLYNRIDYVEV